MGLSRAKEEVQVTAENHLLNDERNDLVAQKRQLLNPIDLQHKRINSSKVDLGTLSVKL
jgi:hypothetical protein